MNKIYKVVWNTVRNCYVVGSELISSKSGRHSTSNGKSSSLKVTLTVLALCGMTALGSGVAPAYAADAGTAVAGQYVAVLVNSSNNSRNNYRTFNGYSYHKERIASTGDVYWVRDGYTIKYEENKRYPDAQNANIIKAYKTDSYTATASSDAGLLKSNQIMVESAGISTLTGVDLDDVSGGTYVGATNSGSTSTPSSFNYMIKDDNGTYVDAGNTNFSKRFKAAMKNTDGTYSYKGEVIANDNLYVVDNKVGVFLTSSGKVYTGKVFGANNEVLMTTKSDSGTMYSYWGADTPDPNTKLADMTIGQFNQALEKVNNNSKAVAGDTIKEIKTTAKTDGGGTIDLIRRGQYNSATGQYEGEHKVGSGITITSHGGTNGEDVKINFSNGTTGFDVAAGSKVEAVKAMDSATDITGLTINGETYNIKTGQTYTEGDNITIDGNKISATDTTLVAGKAEKKGDSYIVKDTAGNEVTLEDVASATTVNNNYTTLDTKINTTETNITNAYTKKINDTKIAITNEYTKYVTDTENYVTGGSINGDTITLNRLQGGDVTITGLKEYVEGKDSYVTGASLKDNKLTITQNNNKGNYEIDLSGFADQFSGTDYRVVANPAEGSKGIYKPDANGNIKLTVEDAKTGTTSTVQLSDVASATTVNNNYTTLDTKINTTETNITNAYTKKINDTKIAITNEYTKYVTDTENYVTGGSINGDTITLNRLQGGDVTITGLKEYVEGKDSYVTGASLKDNKLTITQNNNKGNYEIDLSGFADQFSGTDYRVVANPAEGSKGIYKPDANGNIKLTVEDAKTGTTSTVQLSDVASATTVTNNYNTLNTKVDAAKTTLANGTNTTVEASTAEDGHTEYKVNLNENVKLGDTIQLNGSDGSISATSGTSSLNFNNKGLSLSNGKNSTVINGGTITVNGGESVISGTQATFGKIKLNAESGSTITGLSNTTTKYDGFATAGRAATEEQLKEVAGKASEAIETAGKGWNLTTNGKESSKTNIKPDGTVDFSSGNDNLIISNAGADLSFSLSDNLDLTNNKDKKGSVKVGENTALTDKLLQVGKDVSLTASALNVGNSSLTISALTVGGLTYISSSGLDANNRVISNVAAGKAKTDAVNVGQLESAIRGSQVSIKAGDGISVNKAGNQYTINVNIEGLSNEHGTVHVSTDSDPSVVSKSTLTESETITPAPAKRMNSLLLAEEAVAAEPENGSSTGKKMYVKYTSNAVKLITDDITDPTKVAELNDGEEIFFSGDGNITTTTEPATDGKNTETIRFSLNKDVKVDSIEAKSGNQINIKSEVNMKSQKITNLADGEIAEGSKDAVNGGQIYNLKQNVSTNTENINILNEAVVANAENINSLSHSLNKLDSRINRVGAGAAALAALHPLDFDPDNKWDFAAGYGNYAGANAVAIGTYYRPNENTMFSIGGSFGGGENMINAGVSFKLGSGGSGITTSKTVMAKKIKEQDELLKAQDAKMKEQDEKIAKLEALVAQQGEMIQQALGKK